MDQLDMQSHVVTAKIGQIVAQMRSVASRWEPAPCPPDWRMKPTNPFRRSN